MPLSGRLAASKHAGFPLYLAFGILPRLRRRPTPTCERSLSEGGIRIGCFALRSERAAFARSFLQSHHCGECSGGSATSYLYLYRAPKFTQQASLTCLAAQQSVVRAGT